MLGKQVAANKKKNEDAEFRKAAEERQKDKEESRLALIKIKEQIAQDRAERSDKFNKEKLEREEKRKDQEMQKLAEEAKKAPRILIFSMAMGANYSFELIFIETNWT